MAYAKLFSTITESSLWSGSKEARLLFISMLARADAVGYVEAALPGLARLANLTLPETEAALAELMAPDPYSKSPEAEGRRVVTVDRGWCLVNYESYRARRDEEARREYMRGYMAQHRAKPVNSVNSVNSGKLFVNNVSRGKPPLAQAEAEAEAEAEGEGERENGASAPAPTLPALEDVKARNREALAKELRRQGVPASLEAIQEWADLLTGVGGCKDLADALLAFRWIMKQPTPTAITYAKHARPLAIRWKAEVVDRSEP